MRKTGNISFPLLRAAQKDQKASFPTGKGARRGHSTAFPPLPAARKAGKAAFLRGNGDRSGLRAMRKVRNASFPSSREARNGGKASFPGRKETVARLREARKGDKEGMVRGNGSARIGSAPAQACRTQTEPGSADCTTQSAARSTWSAVRSTCSATRSTGSTAGSTRSAARSTWSTALSQCSTALGQTGAALSQRSAARSTCSTARSTCSALTTRFCSVGKRSGPANTTQVALHPDITAPTPQKRQARTATEAETSTWEPRRCQSPSVSSSSAVAKNPSGPPELTILRDQRRMPRTHRMSDIHRFTEPCRED